MRAIPQHRIAAYRFALGVALTTLVALGAVTFLEREIQRHPARWASYLPELPVQGMERLGRSTASVVMLGDSVVATVARDDDDTRDLATMLDDQLEHESVTAVVRGATASDLHGAQLRFLAHRERAPRAVVVPINPRSFGRTWDHEPGWQFSREGAMYEHPILARAAAVLDFTWGAPSAEASERVHVICGEHDFGSMRELQRSDLGWDAPREVGRARYVARYAGDVRVSPRMRDLERLVRAAESLPFVVLVYVTPVDVGGARALVGSRELACIEENLGAIAAVLDGYEGPHLDLSRHFERTEWFDHPPNEPHEHLRDSARAEVARILAATLEDALARPSR
ncbi:hypothetical protein [Sandaracinus amylolyticus]|uniref:hypothetical protein n=1 Tax=Sandaracinus amylolyticus TaxID=927083 RepID=UPI001F21B631|nr:hypothetical protein [Sandaracinus amylolyticus]UJR84478.1 Hypothetical protein I5071_65570 [Sandaracinus amylolyticus]